jgi:hypothetical protein
MQTNDANDSHSHNPIANVMSKCHMSAWHELKSEIFFESVCPLPRIKIRFVGLRYTTQRLNAGSSNQAECQRQCEAKWLQLDEKSQGHQSQLSAASKGRPATGQARWWHPLELRRVSATAAK